MENSKILTFMYSIWIYVFYIKSVFNYQIKILTINLIIIYNDKSYLYFP